jgi:hypothetical protein
MKAQFVGEEIFIVLIAARVLFKVTTICILRVNCIATYILSGPAFTSQGPYTRHQVILGRS